MSTTLGIIVPYRDRAEHLAAFVPHLQAFFDRDPICSAVTVRVMVSEQAGDLPFNRGFVNNAGFQALAPDVDYICFHDVDLLPEQADYRRSERPAMVISDGLHASFTPEFIRQLFSAVVLMDKAHFSAANGFSNDYWGWGFEDVDLRERLLRAGCTIEHRSGRFRRLPHTDAGSLPDGKPTPAHVKNRSRYLDLWLEQVAQGFIRKRKIDDFWQRDGLSNLTSVQKIHARRQLERSGNIVVEHILVEPLHRPQTSDA
ncbi:MULTISPECIES: galactosyltransferase-related protein [Bradyrhizobium]|uniref:galactosyltransferase-related protein n=1 Tax=Bradyrhizobium TaxID=374 RepID=UPI001ED9F82E|nr:galactosyltransferase-related protein [Bradyrhizobium zhengyangense]MCG2645523.1 galactosyltransferase-related protein [Bradyrhizobium zhengyangense]